MDETGAEPPVVAHKVFTFEESKKSAEESLTVSIPEVCLLLVNTHKLSP